MKEEHQNNAEELMITEKIIEELKQQKEKYKEEINKKNKTIVQTKDSITLAIILIPATTILFGILPTLATHSTNIIPTIFTLISSFSISTIRIIFPGIKIIKKLNKEILGSKLTIEEIDSLSEKNKQKLTKLAQKKNHLETTTIKSTEEYQKIDYNQKKEELEEYLALCYCVGIFEKQIKRCGQEGFIKELETEQKFNHSQVKMLKKILAKRIYH